MRYGVLAIMLILIGTPSPALSIEPLEVVRGGVNEVISILKDSSYQDASQSGPQRDRMWAIIETIFDFQEMGKRTLSRHWKRFDETQKEVFGDLFSQLLGNTYLEKIQRGYRDEEVIYLSEEMITDSKALVKTKILRDGLEIPVFYRMMKQRDDWKIYDVQIEGVSLVKNYRAQFSKVLMNRSPDELLDMLKKKIERQKKEGTIKHKKSHRRDRAVFVAHLYRKADTDFPTSKRGQ